MPPKRRKNIITVDIGDPIFNSPAPSPRFSPAQSPAQSPRPNGKVKFISRPIPIPVGLNENIRTMPNHFSKTQINKFIARQKKLKVIFH